MYKDLFHTTYNHSLIKNDNLKNIINAHQKIIFSKGDLLLESGNIANEYFLIESGLLRVYVQNYNGNEITTNFYGKGDFCIEASSLFQRIPSQENIVALTNVTAWKMEFEKFQDLFHSIDGLSEWGRAWMSNQLFNSKKRAIDIVTKTAKERYLLLIKENPEIVQQASIKYVATYLGITDTSLSRIRREILND